MKNLNVHDVIQKLTFIHTSKGKLLPRRKSNGQPYFTLIRALDLNVFLESKGLQFKNHLNLWEPTELAVSLGIGVLDVKHSINGTPLTSYRFTNEAPTIIYDLMDKHGYFK